MINFSNHSRFISVIVISVYVWNKWQITSDWKLSYSYWLWRHIFFESLPWLIAENTCLVNCDKLTSCKTCPFIMTANNLKFWVQPVYEYAHCSVSVNILFSMYHRWTAPHRHDPSVTHTLQQLLWQSFSNRDVYFICLRVLFTLREDGILLSYFHVQAVVFIFSFVTFFFIILLL